MVMPSGLERVESRLRSGRADAGFPRARQAATIRGPAMRDERGLVCIDGTAAADGRKIFVLRYLQARDPDLAGTPFLAAFSAERPGSPI